MYPSADSLRYSHPPFPMVHFAKLFFPVLTRAPLSLRTETRLAPCLSGLRHGVYPLSSVGYLNLVLPPSSIFILRFLLPDPKNYYAENLSIHDSCLRVSRVRRLNLGKSLKGIVRDSSATSPFGFSPDLQASLQLMYVGFSSFAQGCASLTFK